MAIRSQQTEGHVYVLTSPTCDFVKIGGTDYAPLKRIREINSCEPYKSHGPWSLHDFRQVSDWRRVETSIHYAYRSKLVRTIKSQKELFAISRQEASRHLETIDPVLIVRKPKVDRMFNDQEFASYLADLFRMTAILNWLDLQGAWTCRAGGIVQQLAEAFRPTEGKVPRLIAASVGGATQ